MISHGNRPLVLGLGNELFTDEGIGVVVARAFSERGFDHIDVVDGGTLGIALLPTVAGRDSVLVFDAVNDESAEPGDIVVMTDAEIRTGARILYSAHQLGLTEVIAAADLASDDVARVAAVGLVPFSLDTGYGVTDEAAKRVEAMLEVGLGILDEWGVLGDSGA